LRGRRLRDQHLRWTVFRGFNVQFRAELFNILNQANFASPTDNLAVFDKNGQPVSGAGLVTSTQTTSRQIQLALKIDLVTSSQRRIRQRFF